ncbi:hypothetical protein NHH03_14110 [Stieleria sp. TO1_6]|nr:hypothetical protein [Stieleria tagensis]
MNSPLHPLMHGLMSDDTSNQFFHWLTNANEQEILAEVETVTNVNLAIIEQLSISIADHIRMGKTQQCLRTGGFLFIFDAATPELKKKEKIATMEQEINMSRSQQYKYVDAFKRFRKPLLLNQRLCRQFVPVGLMLLSTPNAPHEAGQIAIERAEKGQIIDKRAAMEILSHFAPAKSKPARKTKALAISDTTGQTLVDEPFNTKSFEANAHTLNVIQARRDEVDAKSTAKRPPSGKVVYEDNIAELCMVIKGEDRSNGPEVVIHILEQALQHWRSKHGVAAIIAQTL